jgi:hypothetical protein
MKRTIFATCLAGAFTVALSAQAPTQQPPSPNPTGTTGATASQDPSQAGSKMAKGGPLTISGCLKAGDTAGTFTLTKVKAGGAAGTTGDAAGAGAASSSDKGDVNLTASASDVDLSKHVGHQIEVTGTPGRGGASAGGTTAGGAATTGGDTAAGAAGTSGRSAKSLNVTSVKMIAESCSQ